MRADRAGQLLQIGLVGRQLEPVPVRSAFKQVAPYALGCDEPEFAVIDEFLKLPQIPPGKLAARFDRFVRLEGSSLQQPADRFRSGSRRHQGSSGQLRCAWSICLPIGVAG